MFEENELRMYYIAADLTYEEFTSFTIKRVVEILGYYSIYPFLSERILIPGLLLHELG